MHVLEVDWARRQKASFFSTFSVSFAFKRRECLSSEHAKGCPELRTELDVKGPYPSREVYFLVKGYWGCAAGWGRIFATGLTIMGLHF